MTVLAWAGRELDAAIDRTRRQINAALFNSSPTGAPLLFGENPEGTVTGTLGAADAESDPLSYAVVTGPAHGAVVVNDDGTFTYTPTEATTDAGGTDSFLVRITDTGNHLHLFHGNGTVTVPVSLTVDAGDAMSVGSLPVAVATSADGKRMYIVDAQSNSVKVYDAATNDPIGAIRVGASPYSIALSPDGTRAYVVNSDDHTISVIDTTTMTTVADPIALGGNPTGIAVGPDGAHIYVTNSTQNRVSVIDTASGKIAKSITVGSRPYGVAVDAAGGRLYVTNEYSDTVSVIDIATNTVTATIAVGDAPTAIAVNASNGKAYVTNTGSPSIDGDGTVSVIDMATNAVVGGPIAVGEFPIAVTFSADGRLAFVANRGYDSVTVIDTKTDTVADTDPTSAAIDALAVGDGPGGLAVDGTNLIVAHTWDGSIVSIPIVDWLGTSAPMTKDPTMTEDSAMAEGSAMTDEPTTEYIAVPTTISTGTHATASSVASVADNDSGYESPSTWGTTGFNVTNNTTATLTLTGFVGSDRPQQGGPEIGSTLAPGASAHFEINSRFVDQEQVQAVYTDQSTGETYTAQMYGFTVGVGFLYSSDPASAACAHSGGIGTCSTGNTTDIYFQPGSNWEADSSLGSQGFDIYNLTQYTLTFTGYDSADRPQFGGPAPGDTLLPGESTHVEVNTNWVDQDDVELTYDSSSGETWTASLLGSALLSSPLSPTKVASTACAHSGGNGSCNASYASTEVDFLDAPNTVVSVAASDAIAQRFVDACASSSARCVFKTTSVSDGMTAPIYITTVNNATPNSATDAVALTKTLTTTTSLQLGAQASAKVFGLVNAQLSAQYTFSTATTNTVTSTVTETIPAQSQLVAYGKYPTHVVVGDLTAVLGNTTITLSGATFVIPDTDPTRSPVYTFTTTPIGGSASESQAALAL
ncbi:YVTN family beta-propeller repeat protein [Mycolicibacterium sp. CBM1]